jgi:hypothetical protein
MFSVYYKVLVKTETTGSKSEGYFVKHNYSEHNQTFGFPLGQVGQTSGGLEIVRRLAKKHNVNSSKIVICSVIPDFQTPGNIYWVNDI